MQRADSCFITHRSSTSTLIRPCGRHVHNSMGVSSFCWSFQRAGRLARRAKASLIVPPRKSSGQGRYASPSLMAGYACGQHMPFQCCTTRMKTISSTATFLRETKRRHWLRQQSQDRLLDPDLETIHRPRCRRVDRVHGGDALSMKIQSTLRNGVPLIGSWSTLVVPEPDADSRVGITNRHV